MFNIWNWKILPWNRLRALQQKLEQEIVERRQIEKELAHLASFPEWDPNAIVEIDLTGSFRYMNPAAGEEFPDLAALKISHPLMEGLANLVEQLRRDQKTMTRRTVKYEEKVYEQQIAVLEVYDRVRLYFVDITEAKRIEQLKNDFVNMVSHELRTPLTAVQAAVGMVANGLLGDLEPDQTKVLSLALSNIDRLARMSSDLLDLSKIEAGKFELHRENVDVIALLEQGARSYQVLAEKKGLAVQVRLPQHPIRMFIDADKIIQVLNNLLNNAMKFTVQGHISLSVMEQDQGVRFEVADTGCGVAPENLPRMFQKFQQFGSKTTSRERGTGLGLSLCKSFVDLHQGDIRVESALGKGTRFIVTLPFLEPVVCFRENAKKAFEEAVESGHVLSLINLSVRSPSPNTRPTPERLAHLESTTHALLRKNSDAHVMTSTGMWIYLPGTPHAEAVLFAERLRNAAVQEDDLDFKVASYPEDGNLLEKLLPLI